MRVEGSAGAVPYQAGPVEAVSHGNALCEADTLRAALLRRFSKGRNGSMSASSLEHASARRMRNSGVSCFKRCCSHCAPALPCARDHPLSKRCEAGAICPDSCCLQRSSDLPPRLRLLPARHRCASAARRRALPARSSPRVAVRARLLTRRKQQLRRSSESASGRGDAGALRLGVRAVLLAALRSASGRIAEELAALTSSSAMLLECKDVQATVHFSTRCRC